MSRIVWFRQDCLPAELGRLTQDLRPDFDPATYNRILITCLANGFWPRGTITAAPFANDADLFHARMPAFDPQFHSDFATITDDRCLQLKGRNWDRPWLVEWSGGLDSTVIVCSILRNLDRSDLSNITIGLTRSSIYENPAFFDQHIRPNFDLLDISGQSYDNVYLDHYLINGEPADMLPGGGLAEHARRCGIDLTLPWRNERQLLVDFLATTTAGARGAAWLYDMMAQELDHNHPDRAPVDQLVEWFWWINFCWKWMPLTLHRLFPGQQQAHKYMASLINWFDSPQYQQWSMNIGRYALVRHATSHMPYKEPWRDYIKSVWSDAYYNKFKIKTASSSVKANQQTSWGCLLDDLSYLTIEQDRERIIQLWPTVVNQ